MAGEWEVRALNPRHYIVRTAWLYHNVGKNFPKAILAKADQSEVPVVNDQFGSPTYAPHLATALTHLIETEAYGTYHIAGSGGVSRFDFAKSLFSLSGNTTKVKPVPTTAFPRPAVRPARAILTTLQDPAFVLPPWEQGLAEFIQRNRQSNG